VADLRDVVEKAKLLLLSKNEGNLLQEFIWETEQINVKDTKLPQAPVEKDVAKQHGNEVLRGVRTLGTLIITNGQFRKLCKYIQEYRCSSCPQ
jgi:predicted restriction endonuclease